MSENKYEVVEVSLESVPYKLLIYKIKISDIDDKLTYFTREGGLIYKSLYEEFLISICVSNIHNFLAHLTNINVSADQLSDVRAELVAEIIVLNSKLHPENLIINNNQVVKMKTGKTPKGATVLSNNKRWSEDIKVDNLANNTKNLDSSKVKNVQDLKPQLVQRFWDRIKRYVTIKQFSPGSELVIMSGRHFSAKASFYQYVVTICVEDIEDLFLRLDRSGLPQRVSPPTLVEELYTMCIDVNPFLDFHIYTDSMPYMPDDIPPDDYIDPFQSLGAEHGNPEDILSEALGKKKNTRLFRDVPKETLLGMSDKIKERVVGQDEAIDMLSEAVQRASVGLKDPERPIGAFVFTGYTGVGKTYTAKILAEALTGSRYNMVSIDCSEYSADHEYAKLIGAPSGYIGHDQGGLLTNAIKKHPFSVVLFDEIEKASDKVHQLLLQIMDESRLTDGRGQKVSFRDVLIIMTSNLGVEETQAVSKTIGFGDAAKLTKEKRVKAVTAALKKKFKPEFINRITAMVNFDKLNEESYKHIVRLELEKLKVNLRLNNTAYSKLSVEFDESLVNYIYKEGIDEKFGARPLVRTIEEKISTPMAKKLLTEDIDCANTIATVAVKRNKVIIGTECLLTTDEPPFYMTAEGNRTKLVKYKD
jgi:ATP-dependent protease Clp ATPase subunit